jgi:hypothetical protein
LRTVEQQRRDPRLAGAGPDESVEAASVLNLGDRVRFGDEKRARFKVRAKGDRYVILTYPFHMKEKWRGNVVYTVIDLELGIRGTDDAIGSLGYETDEAIARAHGLLESGEFEISVRNNVTLDIADVKGAA